MFCCYYKAAVGYCLGLEDKVKKQMEAVGMLIFISNSHFLFYLLYVWKKHKLFTRTFKIGQEEKCLFSVLELETEQKISFLLNPWFCSTLPVWPWKAAVGCRRWMSNDRLDSYQCRWGWPPTSQRVCHQVLDLCRAYWVNGHDPANEP